MPSPDLSLYKKKNNILNNPNDKARSKMRVGRPWEGEEKMTIKITINITEREKEKLEILKAKHHGLAITKIIRNALHRSGII
jgi:hypothetical protein